MISIESATTPHNFNSSPHLPSPPLTSPHLLIINFNAFFIFIIEINAYFLSLKSTRIKCIDFRDNKIFWSMGVDILPLWVDIGSLKVDIGSLKVDFRTLCERMLGVWEPNWDLLESILALRGELRLLILKIGLWNLIVSLWESIVDVCGSIVGLLESIFGLYDSILSLWGVTFGSPMSRFQVFGNNMGRRMLVVGIW